MKNRLGGWGKLAGILCAAGVVTWIFAAATTVAAPAAASQAGAGFRMDLPPGWHAQLAQNGAVVARSGDGASSVVVTPVLNAGNAAAADWLRQSGSAALGAYFRNAAVGAIYPSRAGRNSALATVDYAGVNGPGTAHVLCFLAGGTGTLYIAAAPRQSFARESEGLVRILRSFSFTGERAQERAPNVKFTKVTDPREGAFSMEVPAGWKIEGGLIRKSTLDFRPYCYVASPDGGTVIRFGDPDLGTFTMPTQLLAMAGMREGMNYSPGYGNVWPIRRYMPGPQFAQEYSMKLAREVQAADLQFKSVRPRPEFDSNVNSAFGQSRVTAGEASFSCVRNGRESVGTVLVATQLGTLQGTPGGIWWVAALGDFIAPADQAGAMSQVFLHMANTFEWSLEWSARQQQTTMATSHIVTETNQHISTVINDSYWARQQTLDRTNRNFDDYVRGVVRLRDPNTGEEMEGRAGRNYYYKVPGANHPVGSNVEITNPDLTELQQVR